MLGPIKSKLRMYIRQIVDDAVSTAHHDELFDIANERQRQALGSTAAYVSMNMQHAKQFATRHDLLAFAIKNSTVDGMYLEFGVATGSTINFIAPLVPKCVYGFDSFQGLPEDWGSYMPKGAFAQAAPKVLDNVELVIGWFNETLPIFMAGHAGPISFLHIDCDLYSSTRIVFEQVRDRLVPGSIVVFDEYFNYPGWEQGEHRALMEFVEEAKASYEYIGHTNSQQVAIKLLSFRPLS